MAVSMELFFGTVLVVLALYYYLTSTFDFWKIRRVAGPRPSLVFGNFKDVFFGKIHVANYLQNLYHEYRNEPMFGLFMMRKPVLIVTDPDLIKLILVKDFSKASNRSLEIFHQVEPLSQNLFLLETERWRPLRAMFTPAFSSAKLKEMFNLMLECSRQMEIHLGELGVAKGEPIDCRELAARYATDVIGMCAFGLKMNSLSKEENEFRTIGKRMLEPEMAFVVRLYFKLYAAWLYRIIGYFVPESKVTNFITKLIKDTFRHRRANNIVRNDFINVLMDLEQHPEKLSGIKVTDQLLAAQAFIFFLAGFETTSTTISNALYELAINPDVQDKLRKEINDEYTRNNGELTYEHVKEMNYLEQVFKETLRKYPPLTELERKTTSSFTFEKIQVTVPKDQIIKIPIYAIHRDPDIYPDPEAFKPERFSAENIATRHPMHFLSFGVGPRNCIGGRFALYQVKIAIIKIIRNFKVEPCEETMIPYVNHRSTFTLVPKDGIFLKFRKIDRA